MGTVSVDQRFALLSALGANTDWNSLTSEQVQVGIREAKRAGMEMTEFIRGGFEVPIDFFRETEEVTIDIPALPRPSLEELQAKFSGVKGIKRDTSPTRTVAMRLGTVLRPNDERIDGPEYERRLAPQLDLALGYQQAAWLIERYGSSPWLMAQLGKVYIDFPGLVVENVHGSRFFLCLNDDSKRWDLDWHWIGKGLLRNGLVAFSGGLLLP